MRGTFVMCLELCLGAPHTSLFVCLYTQNNEEFYTHTRERERERERERGNLVVSSEIGIGLESHSLYRLLSDIGMTRVKSRVIRVQNASKLGEKDSPLLENH